MPQNKIIVALYEDNNALRDSLSKLIQAFPDFTLAGAYPNATKIIENTKKDLPDVILMDIDMPERNGIEAVQLIRNIDIEAFFTKAKFEYAFSGRPSGSLQSSCDYD